MSIQSLINKFRKQEEEVFYHPITESRYIFDGEVPLVAYPEWSDHSGSYYSVSGSSYYDPDNSYYGKAFTMKKKIQEQIESVICEYCGQSFIVKLDKINTPVFVLSCPFCGGRV